MSEQAVFYRGAGVPVVRPQFVALAAIGTVLSGPAPAGCRASIGSMAPQGASQGARPDPWRAGPGVAQRGSRLARGETGRGTPPRASGTAAGGRTGQTLAVLPLAGLRGLPRGVWALGLVSMFMDVSSEMIHALLPVYLVTVLGASTLTVGFIEGIAEAVASITRIFSGALSDRLGRRKLLAALGYGVSACTKPIFPLAGSLGWIVAARILDRVGKGIRGAPRDALLADIAPPDLRGASFGLRQSLDTVGAVLGPLSAIGLMALTSDTVSYTHLTLPTN